jgi:YfiH family protein
MVDEKVSVTSPPGWRHYPWLRSGFSSRWGGVTSVYGEPGQLNLGWTAEDGPEAVAENRRRLLQSAGGDALWELVTMRQVHGLAINTVRRDRGPLSTPEGKAVLEGDGLVTSEPGLMLATQTADCVPLLIVDTKQRAVGAFHAGWRGTVARMAEVAVARMASEFGSKPQDLAAAIGPAIRQCCFAVGDEVRESFANEFSYADKLFKQEQQVHIDLHEASRRQLIDAGVPDITVVAACSSCYRDSNGRRGYFSHRAEKGITGRMMGVIGVLEA